MERRDGASPAPAALTEAAHVSTGLGLATRQ